MSWLDHANCAGVDFDVMFPVKGDNAGWKTARRICAACRVREICLEESLDEMFGCWAGTSPEQRVQLRMSRRRKQVSA